MPVSAETLRKLMDAGLSGETLLDIVASIDADAESAPKIRTAHALRQERYRERKASQNVTSDASRDDTPSPNKEIPQTPKEINPLPQTPSTAKAVSAPTAKRSLRLQSDWSLPQDWRQDARSAGLPANLVDLEASKMLDWSLSSKNGAKLDWHATWRNWCRDAAARLPRINGPNYKPRGLDHFADAIAREEAENGNHGPLGSYEDDFNAPLSLPKF